MEDGGNFDWLDWAYKGVDHSFTGNGGPECREFLSIPQRCLESVVTCILSSAAIVYSWPSLKLPQFCSCVYRRQQEPLGKRFLLFFMSLTFGIELGFKFATRQMIWIGNPCHIVTMMQIFILAAPPGPIVTAVFRLHLHMLNGAPIAILFPVINTRLLPFESGVYFLQHILMLVIALYLLRYGDPFLPEALGDFKWALTSLGLLLIYHFVPLQLLAYVSQVNLNSMLCPAVSDPFRGQFYRIAGICHQSSLVLIIGKALVLIARVFQIMPRPAPTDIANVCSCVPDCSCHSSGCCLPPRRNSKKICPGIINGNCIADCESNSNVLNKLQKNSGSNFYNSECSPCSADYNSLHSNISSRNSDSGDFTCTCNKQVQFPIQSTENDNFGTDKIHDATCCRKRL